MSLAGAELACGRQEKPANLKLSRFTETVLKREWAHLCSCYITAYWILKNATAVQPTLPAKASQTTEKKLLSLFQNITSPFMKKCNSVYLNIYETGYKIYSTRKFVKATDATIFFISISVF
jgi:hypothetical protein